MAFEELRDRIKDQAAELWSGIQETSAYNSLREKYESQTPIVQRIILAFGALVAVLIVLWLPLSFVFSSTDKMTQFDENRGLIVGMLHASRLGKESSPLPPPIDPGGLQMQVKGALASKVVPEQIGAMNQLPTEVSAKLAPPGVVSSGIVVPIRQLNLTQILGVATAMANMGAGFKLIGLDVVQTDKQSHYYDVILKVAHFGLPMVAEVEPERPGKDDKSKKSAAPAGDE